MAKPWEEYKASKPAGPWSDYQQKSAVQNKPTKEEVLSPSAALSGAGQALTLGYLPNIQAAVEGILPNPTASADEELRAKGFTVPNQPGYVGRRDENIRRIEQESKEAPISYYGGMLGGAIAQAPLAAASVGRLGRAGKALTAKTGLLGRVGQSAAGGAATGLAQNPGDVEGQISGPQIEERLQAGKIGGLVGAAGQGAGEVLAKGGKAILSAPGKLKELSRAVAFKSSGPMLKDWREAIGSDKVQELGEVMLKKGMVNAGSTYDDVASISGKLKEEAGQKIGAIYKKVGSSAFSDDDKLKLAYELTDSMNEAALKAKPKFSSGYDSRMKDVIGEITSDVDNITDVRHLHEMMTGLDQRINYSKRNIGGELPDAQQGYIALRQKLRQTIDKVTDKIGKSFDDPNLLKSLKDANKDFGNYATLNKISNDKVARESANRMMGLSEQLGGLGGVAVGASSGGDIEERAKNALIYGVGGAAAAKLGRKYALPVATQGARAAGGLLDLGGRVGSLAETAGNAASRFPVGTGVSAQGLLGQPRNKKRDDSK